MMMASFEDDGASQPKLQNVNKSAEEEEEEVNDSPIEEVRLTVPITDDPLEPALTIRTWFLGIISCSLLAFLNQFFGYRANQLAVGSVTVQIAVLPIGRLMAKVLPKREIRLPFTNLSFLLNPGPFSKKEHVLVTIFAGCGASGAYSVHILTSVKAFYHQRFNPIAGLILALTTQLLGYGWAGLFRKYLVDSPYMWWPSNLVQVSLFRTLHEKEKRTKGGFSRIQFFIIVFVCSFCYYVIPGYFIKSISSISVLCLIWSNSITAQQIGSATNGMGIGSLGLDWATIAAFVGSPLATPLFAIINTLFGFFLIVWVLAPIGYHMNAFHAQRFPFFSSHTFDSTGHTYNVTKVLNPNNFELDSEGYNNYSKIYVSIVFAFAYGFTFATFTSSITHVSLFHGKTILQLWRKTTTSSKDQFGDVHTRIMKKNYKEVPEWWFQVILIIAFGLALLACEGFDKTLQLPWWGLLLACAVSFFFTLPIGIIQATTNMQPALNVVTEMIIGYIIPGKPFANVTFKTYGYISMRQALTFSQDFKLGHYMKIPPRLMFIVQLVGTIIASSIYYVTAWWLLTTVKDICDEDMLPIGSQWTCPGDNVFYNASIIWGVVGPLRMFTQRGVYAHLNWFLLIGLLAPVPVWYFSCRYPDKRWIKLIHMPIIFGAATNLPPAKAVNFLYWGAVGIFFNFYVYRWHKKWWARHTYILSAALDAGVAFMAVMLYVLLQRNNMTGPQWWGLGNDHCPVSSCPTE